MANDESKAPTAPTVDALVLGGSAAGKTLLVRHLGCMARGEKLKDLQTSVTTGVELDEVGRGSKSLAMWEVGAPMVANWHTYFGSSYMIVYVVDRANMAYLSAAVIELLNILAHEKTVGVPVLLFLNKSDVKGKMPVSTITKLLRLEELRATRPGAIDVVLGSAKTGEGVDAVLKWLRDTKSGCVAATSSR